MATECNALPTVTFRDGPPPPAGPLPGIRWLADCVELDLPGHGSITVSREGIIASGPSDTAHQQVLGQLGTWAHGQWLRAQGFTTLNGACIARGNKTIVLTGAPRSGCSLLALVLIERGWELTSDGVVAWSEDAIPVRGNSYVTADRAVIVGIDPSRVTPAICGRDRVHVHTPTTGTGPLAGAIFLGRRLALDGPQIVRIDPSEDTPSPLAERIATRAIPALVPRAPSMPTQTPFVPVFRVNRPISVDEMVVRSSAPPILAELIEPALLELCS